MLGRVRLRPMAPNPSMPRLGPPGSLGIKSYWLRFHCTRTSFKLVALNVCSQEACSELVHVSSEKPFEKLLDPEVGSLWLRCANRYRSEPCTLSLNWWSKQ